MIDEEPTGKKDIDFTSMDNSEQTVSLIDKDPELFKKEIEAKSEEGIQKTFELAKAFQIPEDFVQGKYDEIFLRILKEAHDRRIEEYEQGEKISGMSIRRGGQSLISDVGSKRVIDFTYNVGAILKHSEELGYISEGDLNFIYSSFGSQKQDRDKTAAAILTIQENVLLDYFSKSQDILYRHRFILTEFVFLNELKKLSAYDEVVKSFLEFSREDVDGGELWPGNLAISLKQREIIDEEFYKKIQSIIKQIDTKTPKIRLEYPKFNEARLIIGRVLAYIDVVLDARIKYLVDKFGRIEDGGLAVDLPEDFQFSDEDAALAKEKYLFWLKLN